MHFHTSQWTRKSTRHGIAHEKSPALKPSQIRPAAEAPHEGYLVHVLQVAADGHSARESGDFDVERREKTLDVERGRVAFDSGVRGDDDFRHASVLQAFYERREAELVGADSFEGGDDSAQYVEKPLVLAEVVYRGDVLRLLNDADCRAVAGRVGADWARVVLGP